MLFELLRHPFRRTLIQSSSTEQRIQTITLLEGFSVLKIACKPFVIGPQGADFTTFDLLGSLS
jgi:hypothetical protein